MRWTTLVRERHRFVRDLGIQNLEDIVRRCKENQKTKGHADYWSAVKEHHLDFLKSQGKPLLKVEKQAIKNIAKMEWKP